MHLPSKLLENQPVNFWLDTYKCLNYNKDKNKTFCSICQRNETNKAVYSKFTTEGFNNRKKTIERFNMHEKSVNHRQNITKESYKDKGIFTNFVLAPKMYEGIERSSR